MHYGDGSDVSVVAWDEKREVLALRRTGGSSSAGDMSTAPDSQWRRLDIALFARLRVRLTCRRQAPLAVEMQVTRQISASPLLN